MKIISNTAITLDGRISTARGEHTRFGSDEDLRRMSLFRLKNDAVLVGGNSFRNWPYPLIPDPRYAPGDKSVTWNVIVSRTMNFKITREFAESRIIFPLFFTGGEAPPDFPFGVVKHRKITPPFIVDELSKRGIRSLLIEGGGDLIFQFLEAGLLDEMHVTLCPKMIGRSGAPSLADGPGFEKIKNLRLKSHEIVGEEIFLCYCPA